MKISSLLTLYFAVGARVPPSGRSAHWRGSGLSSFEVESRGVRVSADNPMLDQFRLFAQYAGASYCSPHQNPGDALHCRGDLCPASSGAKPVVLATFRGFVTDIRGYMTYDPQRNEIVVSIRGSISLRNWLTDALFARRSCDFGRGCGAHAGFLLAHDEIKQAVLEAVVQVRAHHPSARVAVAGHSLGGAVATLVGAYLRDAGVPLDMYSYGAPRVGNHVLARHIARQPGREYRLAHRHDPIPHLPPRSLGFRHASPGYWISDRPGARVEVNTTDLNSVSHGYAAPDVGRWPWDDMVDGHMDYFVGIGKCDPSPVDVPEIGMPGQNTMLSRLDWAFVVGFHLFLCFKKGLFEKWAGQK